MTQERQNIARAAGGIGLATLASRILGFIRDVILAKLFGATMASDAFYLAYRIPSMLRELFAEGSMSAAFIPVFSQTLTQQDRAEARRLASAAFTVLLLLLSVVTLIAIVFAPWIVRVIAPGFGDELGKFNLTVMLSRFMFPYLMFISLAALAMGILNSLRAFFVPALSPVLFNVVIIASVVWLSPRLTEPIFGAAVGVTLGGLAQFLVQVPSLKKRGMLPGLSRNLLHPGVKRIGWLILPTMIGLSVTQVNILVNSLLASFLPEGSLSYLYYGMRLVLFPLGIFGVALGTAILPSLSHQAAAGRLDELKATLAFGLRMVSFIIVPAMVGLIALRVPIIHLFLEHGVFSPEATRGTASAVLFYSLGLPAFAGVRILVAAFYSLQDTRSPVKIAVVAMVVNIVLNLLLMGPLKHGGLAFATSLSALLNLSLLAWTLHRRLEGLPWGDVLISLGRTLAATVPVGIIAVWASRLSLWSAPDAWTEKGLWLFGAIGSAVVVYGMVHFAMKSEELDFALEVVRKRAGTTERTR